MNTDEESTARVPIPIPQPAAISRRLTAPSAPPRLLRERLRTAHEHARVLQKSDASRAQRVRDAAIRLDAGALDTAETYAVIADRLLQDGSLRDLRIEDPS